MSVTTTAPKFEPFVGTREVAELLGKPESWVYNRGAELGLPRYKVGLIWRYRLSEVVAWIKSDELGRR